MGPHVSGVFDNILKRLNPLVANGLCDDIVRISADIKYTRIPFLLFQCVVVPTIASQLIFYDSITDLEIVIQVFQKANWL